MDNKGGPPARILRSAHGPGPRPEPDPDLVQEQDQEILFSGNHGDGYEMGSCGLKWAHIKTGQSPMQQNHFPTPSDLKKRMERLQLLRLPHKIQGPEGQQNQQTEKPQPLRCAWV